MDEAQFEAMARRHAQDVYAFLVYRTSDPDLAEELLADTFERAFRARARYDPRRSAQKTWLCAIALNRLRDVARSRLAERSALEMIAEAERHRRPVKDPADAIVDWPLHEELKRLPQAEREALALVYGADLTAKQAAKVLGVPTTTVQGRVYRGLEALRRTL